MDQDCPHVLLWSHAGSPEEPARWQVELKSPSGRRLMLLSDVEPLARGERLELLAVVRGLEALDRPSRVTLMTTSRYVRRGVAYGLDDWRRNEWSWEWFGQMVPVKNQDLWQRLDRALSIHQVDCRRWRIDRSHRGGDFAVVESIRDSRRPSDSPGKERIDRAAAASGRPPRGTEPIVRRSRASRNTAVGPDSQAAMSPVAGSRAPVKELVPVAAARLQGVERSTRHAARDFRLSQRQPRTRAASAKNWRALGISARQWFVKKCRQAWRVWLDTSDGNQRCETS